MRYELTDREWFAIGPMLPNKPRGVPRVNDRRVLNGIFWVLRSALRGAIYRRSSAPIRQPVLSYGRADDSRYLISVSMTKVSVARRTHNYHLKTSRTKRHVMPPVLRLNQCDLKIQRRCVKRGLRAIGPASLARPTSLTCHATILSARVIVSVRPLTRPASATGCRSPLIHRYMSAA